MRDRTALKHSRSSAVAKRLARLSSVHFVRALGFEPSAVVIGRGRGAGIHRSFVLEFWGVRSSSVIFSGGHQLTYTQIRPNDGSNYDAPYRLETEGSRVVCHLSRVIVLAVSKLHIVVKRNTVLEFRREALAAILSSRTPQHLWRHAKSRTTFLEYCERTKVAGRNC
jgi:hypothetical protein